MTLDEAKREFRNHLRVRLYGIWDRVIDQIADDAAKIFSRVTPADPGRVNVEALSDAWDFLNDLRAEWSWKKDEPRAGNQADYEHLCRVIEALRPVARGTDSRQRIAELPDEPAVMTGCMDATQTECDAETPDPWTGDQSLMGVAMEGQPPRTSDDAEMALRRVLATHSETIAREACRIFANVRPDAEPEIALPPLPSSKCQGRVVRSSVRPPFAIELNEADMETAREIERLKNELAAANAEIERLKDMAVPGGAAVLMQLMRSEQKAFVAALTAEREAREKAERDCEHSIKERDEAEEALGKIYREVTGKQAVWSSNFGYSECIDLVEQAVWAKEQELGRHIQSREKAERERDEAWKASNFLRRLSKERGSIVSSADCSPTAIAEARAAGRMHVDVDGMGYVLLPNVAQPTNVIDHKWFDPECHFSGCQSLILKQRAEQAERERDAAIAEVSAWATKAGYVEAALKAANDKLAEAEQDRGKLRREVIAAHEELDKLPTKPFKSVDLQSLSLPERIANVCGMWDNDLCALDAENAKLAKAQRKLAKLRNELAKRPEVVWGTKQ